MLTVTPAGGQINCDWEFLELAIDELAKFLKAGCPEPHVVFRCGTVVRVADDDEEFKGYKLSTYQFPETDTKYAETVKQIMRDNSRVWAVQKKIADVGPPIRRAYATLVRQGYIWPGPSAARWAQKTTPDSQLYLVHWPELDSRSRVFNLGISADGDDAAAAAGDFRRQDYMFPEVAAVILSQKPGALDIWRYSGMKLERISI